MATKIEYDVTVKTDEAKKKLERDLASVEAAPGGAPGGGSGGAAADKAAKSLSSLGESAEQSSAALGRVAKGFAGLGISMAASYAANRLPQGSAARDALDYAGGIAGGAVAGSAFGPWGALAGAVVSGLKTYLDKDGDKDAHMSSFNQSELRHSKAMEWKDKIDGLTDIGDGSDADVLGQKLQEVRAALAEAKEAESKIIEDVKKYISEGKYDSADFAQGSLGINRDHQRQLESLEKSMQERLDSLEMLGSSFKAESLSPTDSISRIGGDFAGSASGVLDTIGKNTDKTNSILGSIERKIRKGGTF